MGLKPDAYLTGMRHLLLLGSMNRRATTYRQSITKTVDLVAAIEREVAPGFCDRKVVSGDECGVALPGMLLIR
jgi:hypothetical protein